MVISKNILAMVAAIHHVIERPLIFDSQGTRHGSTLWGRVRNVNQYKYRGLTLATCDATRTDTCDRLAKPRPCVDRDSATRRARHWDVQSDVAELCFIPKRS